MRGILLTLVLALLAAGCDSPVCYDIMLNSLTVTVTDEQAPINTSVQVFCSIDGDPELTLPCTLRQDGAALDCSLGQDRAGFYVVRAVSGDGKRTAQSSVRVREDECHGIPEHLDLVLR